MIGVFNGQKTASQSKSPGEDLTTDRKDGDTEEEEKDEEEDEDEETEEDEEEDGAETHDDPADLFAEVISFSSCPTSTFS